MTRSYSSGQLRGSVLNGSKRQGLFDSDILASKFCQLSAEDGGTVGTEFYAPPELIDAFRARRFHGLVPTNDTHARDMLLIELLCCGISDIDDEPPLQWDDSAQKAAARIIHDCRLPLSHLISGQRLNLDSASRPSSLQLADLFRVTLPQHIPLRPSRAIFAVEHPSPVANPTSSDSRPATPPEPTIATSNPWRAIASYAISFLLLLIVYVAFTNDFPSLLRDNGINLKKMVSNSTHSKAIPRSEPVVKIAPVAIQMQLIPAGEFRMGSPADEIYKPQSDGEHRRMTFWGASGERFEHEGPIHRVRISRSFYIGKHEITQREYASVMGTNRSFHNSLSTTSGSNETDRLPVEKVSWFDAVQFCNRLSVANGFPQYYSLAGVEIDQGTIKRARVEIVGGKGYRLPTEAEWEFACRGGLAAAFHFGSILDPHDARVLSMANFNCLGKSPRWKTTPVGSYSPNSFGLFDMHGNVREWCEDWYDELIYSKHAKNSLTVDPRGPPAGEFRIIRGGSWHDLAQDGRSAARTGAIPNSDTYDLGFRVARTK